MTLSRKAFFRQGLIFLGEALLNPARLAVPDAAAPAPLPSPGVARACNDRCLAQRGGCFSCLESCPEEAIGIALGRGIRIDRERCTGCGICAAICPVTPKALEIVPA